MTKDLISDMLTRIRNASKVKHETTVIIGTNLALALAKVLKEEGFIERFYSIKNENKRYIILFLKYKGQKREPVINTIERISKPGCRIYVNKKNIPVILGNYGTAILSTSKGVMSNHKARLEGIGGEVLCQIW